MTDTDTLAADMPPFLTTKDLAKRYQQPESTIRQWRHYGRGPTGHRVGRRVLYARDDVLAWETEVGWHRTN